MEFSSTIPGSARAAEDGPRVVYVAAGHRGRAAEPALQVREGDDLAVVRTVRRGAARAEWTQGAGAQRIGRVLHGKEVVPLQYELDLQQNREAHDIG